MARHNLRAREELHMWVLNIRKLKHIENIVIYLALEYIKGGDNLKYVGHDTL